MHRTIGPLILSLSLSWLSALAACDDNVKTLDSCGDGFRDPAEACDGSDFGGATCLDHGLYTGSLACNADCTLDTSGCAQYCGDGTLQVEFEDCDREDMQDKTCADFGYTSGAVACNEDCTLDDSLCVSQCGDGVVNAGQDCDDGGQEAGDGCSAVCGVEAGWTCDGSPSICAPVCGDGQTVGDEACDDGVNDGAYGGCMPGCLAPAPYCGDGLAQTEHAEACDGADLLSATCELQGYWAGALACDPSCASYDESACLGGFLSSARFGGTSDDILTGMAVAADGGFVVVGYFYSDLTFGAQTLTPAGAGDVFVARFDANGTPLWAKRFGDATDQNSDKVDVAIDAAGNVVIAGGFRGAMDCGGGALTSAGNSDIFVCKFDVAGNHVFSKRWGNTSTDSGKAVGTDSAGNIFIGAYYTNQLNVEGVNHGTAGGRDIVLIKLSPDGARLGSWAFGTSAWENFSDLVFDSVGNVLFSGTYGAGPFHLGGANLAFAGGTQDAFIAKFDNSGLHIWSRRIAGPSGESASALATDPSGNLFVTGGFVGTTDFSGQSLTSFSATGDAFLARYDPNGALLWVRQYPPGGTFIGGSSLSTNAAGDVFWGGYFSSNLTIGEDVLVSAGQEDFFIARYTGDGQAVWARSFGGAQQEIEIFLRVVPGGVRLAAKFLESIQVPPDLHTSAGGSDLLTVLVRP